MSPFWSPSAEREANENWNKMERKVNRLRFRTQKLEQSLRWYMAECCHSEEEINKYIESIYTEAEEHFR